jgi:hypothetical protein
MQTFMQRLCLNKGGVSVDWFLAPKAGAFKRLRNLRDYWQAVRWRHFEIIPFAAFDMRRPLTIKNHQNRAARLPQPTEEIGDAIFDGFNPEYIEFDAGNFCLSKHVMPRCNRDQLRSAYNW